MARVCGLLSVLLLIAAAPAGAAPGGGDRDGDGIPDARDLCPNAPEDRDGFQDHDGCPDPDNDRDGIPDVNDKCPNNPETYNGYQDQDGCPDRAPRRVAVVSTCGPIRMGIFFGRRSSRIQKRSIAILVQVASVLGKYPHLQLLELQGYADDYRSAKADLRLSLRRAQAVRRDLLKRGIAAGRLVAKGYGRTQKRGKGRSAAARKRNRRVMFKILRQTQPAGRPKRPKPRPRPRRRPRP